MLPRAQIQEIAKENWSVCWPMALIMFLIFCIGIADVSIAGRLSKEIQAAYGIAFQFYFILGIIGNALTVGAVALISRLHYSAPASETSCAVRTVVTATSIAGLVIALVSVFVSGWLPRILAVPAVLKPIVQRLLVLYAFGIPFQYLLVSTNGILRARRQVRLSLLTMSLVCVSNVGLNIVLALHTPLGFGGIALATALSTAGGCVLNVFFLRRQFACALSLRRDFLRTIIHIGWPAAMVQVFFQVGTMVLFAILASVPQHPVETIAAFTNGLRIESIIFLPAFAFNLANAVVVGNLLGQGRRREAFSAGIVTAVMGVCAVLLLTAAVVLNARSVAGFLSTNPVVIRQTVTYLVISLAFEPLMAWGVILGGGLNGAGDTRSVMAVIAFSIWCVRVPLSYLLVVWYGWDARAVWWMMNVSVTVQFLLLNNRYFSRSWINAPVHREGEVTEVAG